MSILILYYVSSSDSTPFSPVLIWAWPTYGALCRYLSECICPKVTLLISLLWFYNMVPAAPVWSRFPWPTVLECYIITQWMEKSSLDTCRCPKGTFKNLQSWWLWINSFTLIPIPKNMKSASDYEGIIGQKTYFLDFIARFCHILPSRNTYQQCGYLWHCLLRNYFYNIYNTVLLWPRVQSQVTGNSAKWSQSQGADEHATKEGVYFLLLLIELLIWLIFVCLPWVVICHTFKKWLDAGFDHIKWLKNLFQCLTSLIWCLNN